MEKKKPYFSTFELILLALFGALIVGAKGSRLELVLNTVYHIGKPVGTLSHEYYEEFESGRFAGQHHGGPGRRAG